MNDPRPNPKLVVVLGMHRSGTSVLARAMRELGAELGENLMPAVAENNDKGFFEDLEINTLCEAVLGKLKHHWHHSSIGDFDGDDPILAELQQQALQILDRKLEDTRFYCIKNPRISILLPFWTKVFAQRSLDVRYLISYRNPLEVADSLSNRDQLERTPALMLWLKYNFLALSGLQDHSFRIVSYARLLDQPTESLRRIADFLDVPFDDTRISKRFTDGFLSPTLKHHNRTIEELGDLTQVPLAIGRMANHLDQEAADQLTPKKAQNRLSELQKLIDDQSFAYDLAAHLEKQPKTSTVDDDDLLIGNVKLIKELTDTLGETKQALGHAEAQLQANSLALEQSAASQHAVAQELQVANTELAAARRQSQTLTEQLANQSTQLSEHKQLVAKAQREAREQQNKAQRLQQELQTVHASKSMVLTAPLRAVRRLQSLNAGKPSSGRALQLWRSIPLSAGTKTQLKDRLFRTAPAVFSRTGAYQRWQAFEAEAPTSMPTAPRSATAAQNSTAATAKGSQPVPQSRPTSDRSFWHRQVPLLDALHQLPKLPAEQLPDDLRKSALEAIERQPLSVSVVMPAWNRAHTIERAINSAFNQLSPPREVIVVDDGSTDGTIELLNTTYAEQLASKRLVIVRGDHGGVSAARNKGLAAATGDIVAYLDSDNEWRPDYLLSVKACFASKDDLVCTYAALSSHDKNNHSHRVRATAYNRRQLIDWNFIDLNVFCHRRYVADQCGDFDTNLKRLVDWEFIIRATKSYTPAYIPLIGVDYYLDHDGLANITSTVPLEQNRNKVLRKHYQERLLHQLDPLRVAYFVYDWPALSQTFVFSELRELIRRKIDVIVYYAVAPELEATLDFSITAKLVTSSEHLASSLSADQRTVVHTHFAYPGAALWVRPACAQADIPYTVMPHAVDIFHHVNAERNQLAETINSTQCLAAFAYGQFHRDYFVEHGALNHKIKHAFQAVDLDTFGPRVNRKPTTVFTFVVLARFIEKKGIHILLEAFAELQAPDAQLLLYGYGPLEKDFRALVAERGLSNVHFKGSISNATEHQQVYEQADCLVAPCVRAENGDMDGFPTVIFEAIAAGIPVITTQLSAIPDYLRHGIDALVVEPGSVTELTDALLTLTSASAERVAAMTASARERIGGILGTNQTVQRLLDTWTGYEIDIFLVTYNTEEHDTTDTTLAIIERIYQYTTTNFRLTIVDNQSSRKFLDRLQNALRDRPNVRLLQMNDNLLCGPASNVAVRHAKSEFAFYICSNEGFVNRYGWEREGISFMRSNPKVPLAGHPVAIPSAVIRREVRQKPEWQEFRRSATDSRTDDTVVEHVQGGIYITNCALYRKLGGFGEAFPHGAMDIEFSNWAESSGLELGSIPSILSLTTKTLPGVRARVTENATAIHPLTLAEQRFLEPLFSGQAQYCNLCETLEHADQRESDPLFSDGICRQCGSSGFGRLALNRISKFPFIHRKTAIACLFDDAALETALGNRLFSITAKIGSNGKLPGWDPKVPLSCALIDADRCTDQRQLFDSLLERANERLTVFASTKSTWSKDREVLNIATEAAKNHGFEITETLQKEQSQALQFDWRGISELRFSR